MKKISKPKEETAKERNQFIFKIYAKFECLIEFFDIFIDKKAPISGKKL